MARGLHSTSSLVLRSLLVASAFFLFSLTTSTASSPLSGSYEAGGDSVLSRSISTCQSKTDHDTTKLLEKRGGKGVDRHLIAGATAATFATLTALMTITGNTIKAHDQNKYGVSRKDAASSSSSSSREVVKSHGAEKGNFEVKADSADSIKQEQPSSNTDSPHQNTTVINNFFYLHHGPKEINLHARQIPPGEEEREQTHLVRRAGLKGRLQSLDPYQKVFEKVEDYGKIGASLGAVTAASIATYSALQAHRAYVLKASTESSPGGRLQQDNSTKA